MVTQSKFNEQGITFIELMVTLSVIALLYALCIPNLQDVLMKQERERTLDTLQIALDYAQTEVLKQGVSLVLCGSSNGKTCNKDKLWSNLSWTKQIIILREWDQKILHTLPPIHYGTLRYTGFPNNTHILFHPNQSTNTPNGTFIYCPKNKKSKEARTLILNDAGRTYFNVNKTSEGLEVFCL
jgi:type IV fimbrial biogenesis protein FimT